MARCGRWFSRDRSETEGVLSCVTLSTVDAGQKVTSLFRRSLEAMMLIGRPPRRACFWRLSLCTELALLWKRPPE